ncbi:MULTISPECIES: hypothetical protein [Bacillaceae]|uniref:Uncharacterized protein n=1 Tax=Evansella alkalicola TaxID=745819 RepID=A0ABS6K2I2_9BACI|nr:MULTISPECIES: hypothetical protein [Bacillaceae]MBU9724212.1 hypothetical protein [Bacillus alkalicola]
MFRQKKRLIGIIIFSFIFSIAIYSFTPWFSSSKMSETFLYFPEDDQLSFTKFETNINLMEIKDENEYFLSWEFESQTDKPVYLRHDVSLFFENGRLADLGIVKNQEVDHLLGDGIFHGDDSGRHEAITYHYAEVHYSDDIIRSKKKMSSDILYVVDSALSPLQTFKEPASSMERKNKELLDSIIDQQLDYVWEGLMEEYNINPDNYNQIPFNKLVKYTSEPLPNFSEEESSKIISRLWEGLYRHYILGINTFTDKDYDPIGNSLPLILLHKDGTHLIIVYETADKTPQQLLQQIPSEKE